MKTATILCACFAVLLAAEDKPAPVLACNLKAIGAAQRPRYNDLMKRLRASARAHSDVAGGYVFQLDSNAISLPEVAEWIAMERLCCPFLTFQLSTSGDRPDWHLTLTGPQGVKALLQAEFQNR
jgi:hypothetical protein